MVKSGSQPTLKVNKRSRNEPIQTLPVQTHYQSVTNFMLTNGVRVLGSRIIEQSGPKRESVKASSKDKPIRPRSVVKSIKFKDIK